MNCRDFELIVLRLARDRILEAAPRAHAEECLRCAARLSEERALIVGVRLVTAEIAKEEAPVRLEAELLRAFRAHTAAAPAQADGAAPALTRPLQRRALAAAALILILMTAAATLRHVSRSPEQREVTRAITPTPSVTIDRTPEPMTPQPNPVINDARKLARGRVAGGRRRLARRPGLLASTGTEVATHFFPLPGSEDFNSLEGGQVVRLELPGSALDEIGLPIDVVAPAKTVTADVLIGPDGLARAIRFIPKPTSLND